MEKVRTTCRLQFFAFFRSQNLLLGEKEPAVVKTSFDMCPLSNAIAKSIEKPKSCDLGFK